MHCLIALAACALIAAFLHSTQAQVRGERKRIEVERVSAMPANAQAGRPAKVPRADDSPPGSLSAAPRAESKPLLLEGRVESSTGASVKGATVCGVSVGHERSALRCADTDERGAFVLERAEALSALVASAPGFRARRQVVPDAVMDGEGLLVLTLEEAPVEVTGTVVDATGGWIVGAVVSVRTPASSEPTGLTSSDAEGRFALSGVAGPLELSVSAEGYGPSITRIEAPVRGLAVVLLPAGGIFGRIVAVDGDAPLADTAVHAQTQEGVSAVTKSTASGEFRFVGLGPGRYDVWVQSEAARSMPQQAVVELGSAAGPVVIRAHTAVTVSGLVELEGEPCPRSQVVLEGPMGSQVRWAPEGAVQFQGVLPGRYLATVTCPQAMLANEELVVGTESISARWAVKRGLTLRGRVESPSGEPVGEAAVNLSPTSTGTSGAFGSCAADALGQFECGGLAVGMYEAFVALGDEIISDPVSVSVSERGAADALLKTRAFGAIEVLVAQHEGESRSVSVFAKSGDGPPIEAVARGNRSVFEYLPLGRYRVSLGPAGDASGTAIEVSLVNHGQRATVSLNVPRTLVIAGRVVDATGAGVADVQVRAWAAAEPGQMPPPGGAANLVLSDERGAFRFGELLPGLYSLSATSGLGSGALESVRAGTTELVLPMRAAARLFGSVRSASGTSIEDLLISYQRSGGPRRVAPAHAGYWDLGWIEPGDYEISTGVAGTSVVQRVALAAGSEQELTLVVAASAGAER